VKTFLVFIFNPPISAADMGGLFIETTLHLRVRVRLRKALVHDGQPQPFADPV